MKYVITTLVIFLSTLAFCADKAPGVKPTPEFKVSDADSLAVREAQVAYMRAKTDTATAQANEQAAMQRLVSIAADAVKHAGADPEKNQLNEEGGKLVIKAIPEAPKAAEVKK